MRFFSPALTLAIAATMSISDAQVKKKSGFFGFGRDEEQISAGLFPVDAPAASPVQTSAPAYQSPARDNDGIFRGGGPTDVQPVSYTIEGGERVEKEVSEKRNFFAFGRKEKEDQAEAALLTPVPDSNYTQPSEVVEPPVIPEPVADPVSEPRLMQDVPEEAIAQPVEEKKSGGFFSFFSRKKDSEPEASDPAPIVSEPVVVTEAEETTEEVPETEAEPTMVEVPADPEFADNTNSKKEDSERDGILPPLPKIKVPKKPTNYENVETIIENGEIVGEDESIVEDNIVSEGPVGTEPPKIVDGVKTYSSWDDVDARSASAADKILQKIR